VVDTLRVWTLIGEHIHGIERNDVDVTEATTQERRKVLRGLLAVVDPSHQCVFKRNSPPGFCNVAIDCCDQVPDRVTPIDGDQPRPQLIIRSV
jgi:hypothetical protein